MAAVHKDGNKTDARGLTGRIIAYVVFITWGLITVLPLIWMAYSSFKSNDELITDIYALPHALFDNRNDEYLVIPPALNVILPYDPRVDTRERLILESATISPGRRMMLHFILKDKLKAIGEIEMLYGKGIRNFAFYDDALLFDGDHIRYYLKTLPNAC